MPITRNLSGLIKTRGPHEENTEERSKERSEDSDEDDGHVRHHLSTNVKSHSYIQGKARYPSHTRGMPARFYCS